MESPPMLPLVRLLYGYQTAGFNPQPLFLEALQYL